jgi:hypothetical protein
MSRLEEVSAPFRKEAVVRNTFGQNDQYNQGHPDALSTGDEPGKGENSGEVGGATDIKTRKTLLAKNQFNPNREYNAGTA